MRHIGSDGYGKMIGYFLVFTVITFSLLGNQSKLIIKAHHDAGDEHAAAAQLVLHDDHHHEDDHHDEHPQDSSEDPIHHHHVEVSTVLVIAVVTPADLSLFQSIVSFPLQFSDELCPPSPYSEIVKPPQMA